MDETIEPCVCGNGNVGSSSTLVSVSRYCLCCGRKGARSASWSLAIEAWNRDMRALRAVRKPEPETKKNRVYAGEWFADGDEVRARTDSDPDDGELICCVLAPNDMGIEEGSLVSKKTGELMAASKEVYRLLKGFLDGEFNDGASSAVIEGAEKLIKKLDLDID